MTGIPPMPVTAGLTTPATAADTHTTTSPPAHVETGPEPLMPGPVAEVPMQSPMVDSQLGGLYIQMHMCTMMAAMFPLVA